MAPKTSLGPLESGFLVIGSEEKDSSYLPKIRVGFLHDHTDRPTQPKTTFGTGFWDLLSVVSDFQVF